MFHSVSIVRIICTDFINNDRVELWTNKGTQGISIAMRENYILLIFLLLLGCSRSKYSPTEDVLIDAGMFTVVVREGYKIKQLEGVDSSVGIISNGRVKFEYDFGWYSSIEPVTLYESMDRWIRKGTNFYRLADSLNLNASDSEQMNLLRSQLVIDSFSVLDSVPNLFVAYVTYGDQHIKLPYYPVEQELSDNIMHYKFIVSHTNERYTKIYYPKHLGDSNYRMAGVYIENLSEKKEKQFGFNRLGFYTADIREHNKEEILTILKSVRIK